VGGVVSFQGGALRRVYERLGISAIGLPHGNTLDVVVVAF